MPDDTSKSPPPQSPGQREARAGFGQTPTGKPGRDAWTWTGVILGLLVIVVIILVAIWDWNWFRGPLARAASARLHRDVAIEGPLTVHAFSWQPSATVQAVRIAKPAWAGRGDMAEIGRIAVRIRLVPLLGGHLDMRLLEFDHPRLALYRDVQGRATWDFSDGKNPGQPLKLPPIRQFVIHDGRLVLSDLQHRMQMAATLSASEQQGASNNGFVMRGQGSLNAQPFAVQLTGGPLINIDRDKPYPFDVYARAGQTYVTARGAVTRPFDLGRFEMSATARGPDLAELYGISSIALPNTPPYELSGRLSRDGRVWRLTGIDGRVGDSDLSGELTAKTGLPRPFVQANLHTRVLDFPDVGALIGGGSKTGKVASPSQKAAARALQARQGLLPDTTLNVSKIRSVDADVSYRAETIRNAPMKLTTAAARVRLDDGLLRVDPLAFTLPQGRLAGMVQLDARKAVPVTSLDLRLSNARLEHVAPIQLAGGPPFEGALVARAKLTGAGDSVHKAFGHANGEMTLVVPGGEIRKTFAELLGIDVVKGLGLLLSKDEQSTPIRCGVAQFQAADGLFKADQIVIDTGPVLVTGSGAINMDSERIDLKVQGHPKKFRLVRLRAPITAEGPLLHPKIGVEPGGAIAQGGAAVALAALLTPIAAILPFVDPGLAKDANCSALIAEGRQHGAPVRTASSAAQPPRG